MTLKEYLKHVTERKPLNTEEIYQIYAVYIQNANNTQ